MWRRNRRPTVTLDLEHAKHLLRFMRLRSGPGDRDPVNAGWQYLYALEDAVTEAEK